jgi:hypothetical protein
LIDFIDLIIFPLDFINVLYFFIPPLILKNVSVRRQVKEIFAKSSAKPKHSSSYFHPIGVLDKAKIQKKTVFILRLLISLKITRFIN